MRNRLGGVLGLTRALGDASLEPYLSHEPAVVGPMPLAAARCALPPLAAADTPRVDVDDDEQKVRLVPGRSASSPLSLSRQVLAASATARRVRLLVVACDGCVCAPPFAASLDSRSGGAQRVGRARRRRSGQAAVGVVFCAVARTEQ